MQVDRCNTMSSSDRANLTNNELRTCALAILEVEGLALRIIAHLESLS